MKRKGQASILLDYDQGKISVFHGTDKTLLKYWEEKEDDNDWDLIWNLINSLAEEEKEIKGV